MHLQAQLRRLVDQGASVEEAAEALGVHPVAAKCAAGGDIDFSDQDLGGAIASIVQISQYGEIEANRLKAAEFIYETKKKIRAPKVADETNNAIILELRESIDRANNEILAHFGKGDRRGNCDAAPALESPKDQGTTDQQEFIFEPRPLQPAPVPAPRPVPAVAKANVV